MVFTLTLVGAIVSVLAFREYQMIGFIPPGWWDKKERWSIPFGVIAVASLGLLLVAGVHLGAIHKLSFFMTLALVIEIVLIVTSWSIIERKAHNRIISKCAGVLAAWIMIERGLGGSSKVSQEKIDTLRRWLKEAGWSQSQIATVTKDF